MTLVLEVFCSNLKKILTILSNILLMNQITFYVL